MADTISKLDIRRIFLDMGCAVRFENNNLEITDRKKKHITTFKFEGTDVMPVAEFTQRLQALADIQKRTNKWKLPKGKI